VNGIICWNVLDISATEDACLLERYSVPTGKKYIYFTNKNYLASGQKLLS